MSTLKINSNDKVVEEFAKFTVKMIQRGAKLDTKNERKILNGFGIHYES